MIDPAACGTIGRRQGPRFKAFYGCMFYALMRPSEVAALTRNACHLPGTGWGHLTFTDASPAPGKAYTDDGQVHEHRGLKGRTKGRPSMRKYPGEMYRAITSSVTAELSGSAPSSP